MDLPDHEPVREGARPDERDRYASGAHQAGRRPHYLCTGRGICMATAGAHQAFPTRIGEANGGLCRSDRRASVGRWTVCSDLLSPIDIRHMCLANFFWGGGQ